MAIYSLSRIGFLQGNVKQSMRQSMYNIVVGIRNGCQFIVEQN